MTKLDDITKEFEKYIVLKDPYALRVILGTLIGNAFIQRDPLWLMMVAPSSGGKSTLLAPCCAIPSVYFLDDLTEKTFLSGYKIKGKETSLLKVIGSGILCFSDFTSILSKNPTARGEILGQLRLIYDGNFSKRTGTGEIKWVGKMGFLGAATPDIYHILETSRSMGERFIYYSLTLPSDDEIVIKQQDVTLSSREISEVMQPLYRGYIDGIRELVNGHGVPPLVMTKEQMDRVNAAAMFCVSAKATVHLDFKTNKPDALVNKPGVGRDRKMFTTFLHAMQLMEAYDTGILDTPVSDEMVRIVEKCAYSSVGRERRKVLEILTTYDIPMSASQIGATDDFGLPKEGVEKYLYVLHSVGLVQKETNASNFRWYIESDVTKKFVRDIAGLTPREASTAHLSAEALAHNQQLLDDFENA